jgi:hypothetical protein
VRQAVGDFDIGERHLDVGNGPAAMRDGLYRPLMLVQQGDGADQRQVLGVIAWHVAITPGPSTVFAGRGLPAATSTAPGSEEDYGIA